MSRLGWFMLAAIALLAAAFATLTRCGPRVATPPPVREAAAGLLLVPVAGVARDAIVDSWGDAREGQRAHHGTDIPATHGTPVLAAGPGRVEKLFASRLGGITLYQRADDGRHLYYYAHLAGYAPGIAEGRRLRAGEPLGYVGDTGNAGAGNDHLHFGLIEATPMQGWWQGREVNPFPLLAGRPGRS